MGSLSGFSSFLAVQENKKIYAFASCIVNGFRSVERSVMRNHSSTPLSFVRAQACNAGLPGGTYVHMSILFIQGPLKNKIKKYKSKPKRKMEYTGVNIFNHVDRTSSMIVTSRDIHHFVFGRQFRVIWKISLPRVIINNDCSLFAG